MPRRARARRRPQRQQETLAPAPVQKGQPYDPGLLQGPQALPLDPIYTSDVGAINLGYDQTLAGITFDRTQLGQTYGFDAAGNLDPSNSYSVAANLQRRYQQGQSGTQNSFAAAGQLYSGARQRNLDEGTYQYNRSYDQARRAAQSGYQDLTEREQQAGFNRTIGLNDAASDRLGRVDPATTVPQATQIPRQGVNVQQAQRRYRRRRRNG